MKKTKILIILGILIVIVGITGFSYALWSKTFTQTGNTTLASDCFNVSFIEDTSSKITLENSFPITDEAGKNLKPYTFSITNNCNTQVEYQLNLETTLNTTMKEQYIRMMLNEKITKLLTDNLKTNGSIQNVKNAYQLDSGFINGLETIQYNLRIWMDSKVTQNDTDAMNATFESKISITGKYSNHYYEPILNGTDPIIKDNLLPITIERDGTVKKADMTKSWYNYEQKNWANAIILEDETKIYNDGEIIPESNIESYFVWIPRYKYKIFNDGNYPTISNADYMNKSQTIEMIFENKNTAISNGSMVGQWLTHPAFTTFDSNGMWVGKFETGYKEAPTTLEAEHNIVDPNKIEIKPNVYSWRGINLANSHLNSYNYKRNLDSHMMKNTEWGSVAYLSHSKFGTNKKIRLNNNYAYLTGFSALQNPTVGYVGGENNHGTIWNAYEECFDVVNGCNFTFPWNNEIGSFATTTGNISGIYDMSGGSWENVMSMMSNEAGILYSGRSSIYNSGFNGLLGCPLCDNDLSGLNEIVDGIPFPDKKYFDIYQYSINDQSYQRRILGDATGEIGPILSLMNMSSKNEAMQRNLSSWYKEEAWNTFVYGGTWFNRGGGAFVGSDAGIFAFSSSVIPILPNGENTKNYASFSFRVVLAN